MLFHTLLCLALTAGAEETSRSNEWNQWRGPKRDGVSADTGLLSKWPKQGPPLVWQAK